MTEHDHRGHGAHSSGRGTAEGDAGSGHDKHEGHTPEMFRDRLWVSLVLTIPILYFSDQIQAWLGFEATAFRSVEWVNPVLATVLFVYAGSVFLKGGLAEWRVRRPGMMILISIAISVAYFYSVAVSLGLDGAPFYWELATLLDVMLLGHWMEMRSIQSASTALERLASMVPATAHRIGVDGAIEETAVGSLVLGDVILIRPGEQVPADGEISDGSSSMNEAFLTGESRPVAKRAGDEVIAGAVNGEGALTVLITRIGDSTTLSQIMRLVSEAQTSRSRFQALADRAAFWLTIVAVAAAVPTFIAWAVFGSQGITFAVARAVTVLVIACPHALGLAIPLVTMNATGMSARSGILVRNREAFERGRNIALVALDKTGTLTEGRLVVSEVTTDGTTREDALAMAAALERASEHPLASAIVDAAEQAGATRLDASEVAAVPGRGIGGSVWGKTLRIGRPEWVEELGVEIPQALREALSSADARGETAVVLMEAARSIALITLADRIRDTALPAMARLRSMGVVPVMVTGDSEAVAKVVARELGIERYHARVLPQDKARIVHGLQDEGPTAFVGDGINDAPALLAADLGVAIGAGTNVAIESADLVLVNSDPADVARALILARATHRKMIQNLTWATGYNVVAIPLAAGVAVGVGLLLSPALGALFMSLSTIIVAINAMLLRRVDLASG